MKRSNGKYALLGGIREKRIFDAQIKKIAFVFYVY